MKNDWDNCKTCAHAVDPTQTYGICLRDHNYIKDVLQEGKLCDQTFKGWTENPSLIGRFIVRLMRMPETRK